MQEQSNLPSSPAWILRSAADAGAMALLAKHLGCPESIARALVARGIDTPENADAFFHPQIEGLINSTAADPMQMLAMAAAVERILAAIGVCEPILIYGDYDVDGTTATVLLKTAIERIGLAMQPPRTVPVTYHVPHRIREGYGMQVSVLALAAESGVRLVISVDTGIRAIAEAAEARTLGLDLIVTDHHLPDDGSALPDALAVINPNQRGCPYPNKNLCGAAVAFKLAQALLTAAAPLTPDPDGFRTRACTVLIPSFLKLVAIATIADSVPLVGENRTIAALGLAALANPVQPGLRSLMQLASIPLNRAPTAGEVGFRIAPRINAAGRMDVASDVVELFLTRDPARAHDLAAKLDRLNQNRRDSEARALDAIDRELLALLGANGAYPPDCLILDDPDWHRGVLGILASRVVERTGRPALVVTHADGAAHGSGRSVPGFHLLDALAATDAGDPAAPLFNRFGGHAHAVGFSLPSSRLPLLRDRMKAYTASLLTPSVLTPQLDYDAELTFADLTPRLVDWIARCAPFGIGNSEPTFLIRNLRVVAPVRLIQQKHVCLQLAAYVPDTQRGSGAPAIPGLGWSRGVTNWTAYCAGLGISTGSVVDVLCRVRRNTGQYAGPYLGGLELELCAVRSAGVFEAILCSSEQSGGAR